MTTSNGYTAIGTFWIAGDNKHTCDGTLRIKDQTVRVDVVGDLTPAWVSVAGTGAFVRAQDDDTEMVIHGSVSENPGRVTIVDARSLRRQTLFGGGQGEKSSQVMAGEYCIFNAHIPAKDSKFRAVRIRLDSLEEWAVLQGLKTEINHLKQSMSIDSNLPEAPELQTTDPGGVIKLTPVHSYAPTTLRGTSVKTSAWLEWRPDEGWDFTRVLVEFVYPMQALFTILFNRSAIVEELEVSHSDQDRWLPVHGSDIGQSSSPAEATEPIVTRTESGLELIAGWLQISRRLGPVPQILAAAIANKTPYVDSEVLNLCTAAEGLHRRLFPNARRLSKSDIEATVAGIKAAKFPGNAGELLESAIQYLGDPSFPMRLSALAAKIETTAPEITGATNRWKKEVTTARNGNAHSLAGNDSSVSAAEKSYVLARSLRWLLAVSLLLEAGVPASALRSGLLNDKHFQNFIFMARRMAPKIYEDAACQ